MMSSKGQDLDSSGFAVKLAYHIWSLLLTSAEEKNAFYKKWGPALERGMNATTHDPEGSGLLWSNISAPVVGYVYSYEVIVMSHSDDS